MKKYLFIFAAAAAVLAGCSKGFETEDPSIKDGKTVEETTEVPDGSFLCSFAMNGEDETKTTINASDDNKWYLIKWEKGDTISVTRTTGGTIDTTATFTAQSDGAEVLFRNKDVTGFFKDGATYTATFGKKKSSSYTVKDGSAKHIYMTATCEEPHRKFVFHTESETAFLAVKIPDEVSAKGLIVKNGDKTVATLKSSGEAIKAFYVPVAAGDHKFQIEAYQDAACSTIIAESMKMYSSQTLAADKIYPFTFTPTLKVTGKGEHSLQSYPGDYKVWICNDDQKSELSLTDIADSITVTYADGAAQYPANVYVDAKKSTVAKLVINTTYSHVEISNGESTKVTSKTNNSTFVVKPSYTIKESVTVQAGSITVEGNDGVKNVDTVILAYPNKDAMAGVVVSVTKVTTEKPVYIKNTTTATGSEPINVVGTDNTDEKKSGGYKIEDGKDQNINKMTAAVAKIGDKVYASLDSAILKVKAGETITLIDDCETGADYNFTNNMLSMTADNVTLDLNGKTITETNKFSFAIAGNNAVVKNGYIKSGEDTEKACKYHSYALVIAAKGNGEKITGVQIKDVVFTGGVSVGGSTDSGDESVCKGSADVTFEGCSITSGNYYITYSQPVNSTATILSGTYKKHDTCTEVAFATQKNSDCKILLKGGTYNFDPTEWVAEGYEAVKSGSESAGYFWTVQPKQNVAKIGNTKYATLAEAVAAAKDGDIIKMLEDHCISSQIEIADKEITLELDGYTVSCSTVVKSGILAVHNGAGLTVSDGKGTGKVEGGKSYAGISVTVSGDSSDKPANLTVKGGTIEGLYYGIAGNGSRPNTQITINGGTVKGTDTSDSEGIYHPQNGTLTITGGTVEGCSGVYMKSGSAATLTGGTINGTGKKRAYKSISSGCEATGDAIIIDNCGYPGGAPSVTVSGTDLSSANACQVGAYYGNGLTDISDIYSTDNTLTVPESYIWQDNGGGQYKLVKSVAKIGNTYYTTLASAVAAVPANTETTITMVSDHAINANGGVAIPHNKNIILELNGKTIYATANEATTAQVISNQGILTIQDCTDTQKDGTGTGKITGSSLKGDTTPVPGYASNIIKNGHACAGATLTIKSGLIEKTKNESTGWGVAIDNSSNSVSGDVIVNIEGGKISYDGGTAIRQYNCSVTYDNIINITGGTVTGKYGVWIQYDDPKAQLNISGGTVTATGSDTYDEAIQFGGYNDSATDGSDGANMYIRISDNAQINGSIWGYAATKANVLISGGKIKNTHIGTASDTHPNWSISGGVFAATSCKDFEKAERTVNLSDYIASGYTVTSNPDASTSSEYPWTVVTAPDEWQYYAASEFSSVEGNTITIMNAAELAKFAKEIATWSEYSVVLGADIDLSAHYWNPIASFGSGKNLDFNGNGKTITGMKVAGTVGLGLFASLNKADVHDLTISNAVVTSTITIGENSNCAVLAGQVSSGSIVKVKVDSSKISANGQYVGAIFGSGYSSVRNCEVSNCEISGTEQVGGALGYMWVGHIEGCTLTGNKVHATNQRAGGLIGKVQFAAGNVGSSTMWIKGNTITGATVTAAAAGTVGGIAGQIMGDCDQYEISGNSIDAPGVNCPIGVLRSGQDSKFTSVLAEKIDGNSWTAATYAQDSYIYPASLTGVSDQEITNAKKN